MNKYILNKNNFNKYINNKYINDFYIKKSKKFNLISRSWFKIYEINKKYNVFNKKNMNIIDLGSSPGGWSKFSTNFINKYGSIFSCDILPMNNINGVNFFQGDLSNIKIYNKFIKFIYCDKIDIIISDMLCNTSGFNTIDNYKNLILIKIILKICFNKLLKGGSLVFKILQNNENNFLIKKINSFFKEIYLFKPNSSRDSSREFYIIAKKFCRF